LVLIEGFNAAARHVKVAGVDIAADKGVTDA